MGVEEKLDRVLNIGAELFDLEGILFYVPGENPVKYLDRALLLWMEFNEIVEEIEAVQTVLEFKWYPTSSDGGTDIVIQP